MDEDIDFRSNISFFDRILPSKQRLHHFFTVRRLIKNWPVLIRLAINPDLHATVILKSGKKIKINGMNDFLDFWHSYEGQVELLKRIKTFNNIHVDGARRTISFDYMGRKLSFAYGDSKGMLEATLEWIRTQFFEEQYKWLDVKGSDVVDIGASVGDTAIYFALKGAKHVYGFELDRERAALATKNAKLNGFNNIKITNAGCGKPGKIKFGGGEAIIESLDRIVEVYKLKDAVLKMDCEGCEYYSLLNASDKTLGSFKQIMLEYHHGYKNIQKRLKDAGFRAWHSRPEIFKNGGGELYLGFLYAIKNNH